MSAPSDGWIGVDLDGTLARYDGWVSEDHIGEPIPRMVDRVKAWLAEGADVRIFTARVSGPEDEAERARDVIVAWCREHLGHALPVTCIKDYHMRVLWDDRAVQVEANTGMTLQEKIVEVYDRLRH